MSKLSLIIPSIFEQFGLDVYLCVFPCRYLTLAPETAEETFVEISDTEPEDPATSAPSTDYPGKGVYISFFIAFSSLT